MAKLVYRPCCMCCRETVRGVQLYRKLPPDRTGANFCERCAPRALASGAWVDMPSVRQTASAFIPAGAIRVVA